MPIQLICAATSSNGSCSVIDDNDTISAGYTAYLNDESRSQAAIPERIYFPESIDELAFAVRDAVSNGGGITVSGARTGIAGGAVSQSQNLISLDRWKKNIEFIGKPDSSVGPDDAGSEVRIRCSAGTTLDEVQEFLAHTPYRYPVDPTEMTASVGGTISTNASGARTLFYGPTRSWVHALVLVLADGEVLNITRGESISTDGTFELVTASGAVRSFQVHPVNIPSTKHNAGYFLRVPADPIDLFIGSEGTLGIVAEAELDVARAADTKLGVTLFLPNDNPVNLVESLLELKPIALEYLDGYSLTLLADARDRDIDSGAVPPFPNDAQGAVYVEFNLESEDGIEAVYEQLESLMEKANIDPESSWAGFDESEIEDMKRFRHALPERVNSIISERKRTIPELTKIGTDMAVPVHELSSMLAYYRSGIEAASIEYCIFGHIGNGHVHVNLMPKSLDELRVGRELYHDFAVRAVECGGSVAAEHGLGRLKRSFLEIQYDATEIEMMKSIKRVLDPDGILNPGVLF